MSSDQPESSVVEAERRHVRGGSVDDVSWLPLPEAMTHTDPLDKLLYITLSELGEARAVAVRDAANTSTGTTYERLNRLEERGLVKRRPALMEGGDFWSVVGEDTNPLKLETDGDGDE